MANPPVPPTLTVREPGRVAYSVALTGEHVVGRDPTADLVLVDRQASRRHVRFFAAGGMWRVADLGSRHGTRLNGNPLVGESALSEGDRLQVGSTLLTFSQVETPAEEALTVGEPSQPTGDEGRRLRILYDISRAIDALDDPDELAARMLESAIAILAAERGVIGLGDGKNVGGRRIARGAPGDLVVSRGVLEALARRERVLVRAVDRESQPTLHRQGVRSAVGVPLVASGAVVGFLYVDSSARAAFTESEVDFLGALGQLLAGALLQARQHRKLADLAAALQDGPVAELYGASDAMRRLREEIRKYAAAGDANVLVRGESGTGKELCARALHALSPRAGGPFVAQNCAALPEAMVESELFGHEKGSFSGALKSRRGKFALADGGTLFLDEIGDLSLAAQAKILRVLEDGEIWPVGADAPTRVSVRVVAATNKPLEDDIAAGRFRQDLYFRLAVGEIHLPPLRARGEDVVLLAELFLHRAARRLGRPITGFSDDALDALRSAAWNGNVRQLKNQVERAAILCDGPVIQRADIGTHAGEEAAPETVESWETLIRERAQLDEAERRIVGEVLRKHGGVVARAARELGMARSTLASRLEALGIAVKE
jgi:Nif-specific regulatory protein